MRRHDEAGPKPSRRTRQRITRSRRLVVGGAVLGATATYFLDPAQGRRRRAQVQDKVEHFRHSVPSTMGVVAQDSRNRGRGLLAGAGGWLNEDDPTQNRMYQDVKEAIAVTSGHPRAIKVRVADGYVTLTGPVLASEVDQVRAAVSGVTGVQGIDDQLDVHLQAGDIPALQGDGQPSDPRSELLQRSWAPGPRALAGAVGGAVMFWGLGRRGLRGLVQVAGGGLLLARAVTNRPVQELTGIGAGAEVVQVDKSIKMEAPVEEVWSVWEDVESFPTFMTHVLDVREDEDGASHWRVEGPLGTTVEWDAEVVEVRPNEGLAWRSRPGSAVQHAGEVELEPADGGSRVRVRLSYNPAAGVAGHAVGRILGADAKTRLDDELLRMKTLVETGKPPRDAARR